MIRDRIIVCLASSWDFDPTSKHHIMSALSEHNSILWVNYHGTRRPTANRHDLNAAWKALLRVARGARDIRGESLVPVSASVSRRCPESFVQVTPLVIPGASGSWPSRANQWMLEAQIRRALRQVSGYGSRPLQVWTFAPDVPYLIGKFNEERFVYYCVDEYREFEDFDRAHIARMESELLCRADVVITSSDALWQSKRAERPDAALVRHGVAYDHFAAAWRSPLPRPADLADVRPPLFGFFGLIHHWLDLSLLSQVASLRPHYTFVLLGETKVDVSGFRKQPNVLLLGRRKFDTLPAYCAAFDAALLPFKRSTMTRNINPIKMIEYLAAGLPVVSTSLPEAERFRGPIGFADTPEAFAVECDAALRRGGTGSRERISRMVEQESWAEKVDALSQLVLGSTSSGTTEALAAHRTWSRQEPTYV